MLSILSAIWYSIQHTQKKTGNQMSKCPHKEINIDFTVGLIVLYIHQWKQRRLHR